MRKDNSRKTGRSISCFWDLIPTPGWILELLDLIFDPQNRDEVEHFNIKRETEESSQESEKPAQYQETAIPDTGRQLLTIEEEQQDNQIMEQPKSLTVQFKADKQRQKLNPGMKTYMDIFDDISTS